MKPQRHSTDGFISRRAGSQLGEHHSTKNRVTAGSNGLQPVATQDKVASLALRRDAAVGLSRSDIDESLNGITPVDNTKQGKRRLRSDRPKKSKARRIIKLVLILLLIAVVAIGGWLAYRTLSAGGNIFKGNILGLIQSQPLKEDANGRSNILVLGTSEDDPGHDAGQLTDSMMVISIDQKNKNVSMFSIPRDLYVRYGINCSATAGKINAFFACANTGTSSADEQDRLAQTQKFVGNIFGMDIQYGVHVNNTVIKEAVDAVGGVDINLQGNGPVPYGVAPGSILDRNFDWRCGYKCYLVKYSPGVHHLDGEHALFLAMARGDVAPTYGLADSNFDREKNQQKIIVALKQKAATTGTLTDIGKVTSLIDTLGTNLRTTFETSEIRTLMSIGSDVKPENIKSISLFNGDAPVVTTGNYGGASVVMPSAGMFDYTKIRQFLAQQLSTDPVTQEAAGIVVLNGSGVTGAGQTEADKLTKAGFIVKVVDTAPAGTYGPVAIYQVGTGMGATKAKLESRYGTTVKTSAPPVAVGGGTNFVIIIGKGSSQN
jgi:LCP family protein required for cell wall assembly